MYVVACQDESYSCSSLRRDRVEVSSYGLDLVAIVLHHLGGGGDVRRVLHSARDELSNGMWGVGLLEGAERKSRGDLSDLGCIVVVLRCLMLGMGVLP